MIRYTFSERKVALDTTKCGRREGGCKKVDKQCILKQCDHWHTLHYPELLCHTFSERNVSLVLTKLDQSSEKTKKNVVSAKIKKFTRVVLQTVKGRWTLWRLSSSRLRRTPIARVLTLMKYIKQPRSQTVQVKSDHEDGPIIWWLKLVNI